MLLDEFMGKLGYYIQGSEVECPGYGWQTAQEIPSPDVPASGYKGPLGRGPCFEAPRKAESIRVTRTRPEVEIMRIHVNAGCTLFVFGIHTGYTLWNLGICM